MNQNQIKEKRISLGITRQKLAEYSHCSASSIYNAERGKIETSEAILHLIEEGFKQIEFEKRFKPIKRYGKEKK